MAERYDAIVIGAGVIGASVGLELARAGRRTLNIDRLPASGYGSTSSSCAVIRVYYSTLDGTALAYESYHVWKDWQAHLGADDERGLARFIERPTLLMRTEANGQGARFIANMDRLGIPYQLWSAADVTNRLPIYDLSRFAPAKPFADPAFGEPTGGSIEGAILFPTGGWVNDPQLAAHNLQRAAEAKGGRFLFNSRVVEIAKTGGRVSGVVLDDGRAIEAPVVVNVAGPHSSQINRLAGADGDMQVTTAPLRQEVVHLDAPAGFDFEHDGLIVSDSDIAVYCRPEIGNRIVVGTESPACDPRVTEDPDGFDRALTDQATLQAMRYAQRVPEIQVPRRPKGVVDLYDVTEDWTPIYDRSCVPGFYMACGTSGNQFKNAPVAGRLMAALIEHCEAGHDHDREPLKVPLRHVDHALDMATFSRLRRLHAGSTFSVVG